MAPYSRCHFADKNPTELLLNYLGNADSNQILIAMKDHSLSYGEMHRAVLQLASYFSKQGLLPGQRAVVGLSGDKETLATLLALAIAGIVATPFDPQAASADQAHMLSVIDPDFVLFSEAQINHWQTLSTRAVLLTEQQVTEQLETIDNTGACWSPPASLRMHSPMMILYTSGTTAQPKGVQLSYQAVLEQSRDMVAHLRIDNDSRILNLFRYYQIGSLVNGLYLALLGGATLHRPFTHFQFSDALLLLEKIPRLRITHFVLVPTLLAQLMKLTDDVAQSFAYDEFIALVSTAAHLPPVLWQKFEAQVQKPIINTYGLTEANDITATALSLAEGRIGSIGQALNCQIKILNDDGNELPVGQEGILHVRGKTQMDAYFNAPQLTQEAVIDGWFNTGDLASVDAGGRITYLGRASERIISGGHTIHPSEISHLLLSHPDIVNAYVFGEPHDEWQELVAACIVARRQDLSKAEVMTFLRERLASYKLPRKLYFMDDIPISDRGKVRRRDVLKLLAEAI